MVGGLAVLFAATAAFVGWTDPFQVFRRSSGVPNFYGVVEYQIPGIARHYPFDAVVVGTSTSNNFTAASIERALGWHAVNLANAGSTVAEQHAILRTSLATGKVRHVFWGLDPFAFRRDPVRESQFPSYLYAGAGWRRAQYLWNLDALSHGLRTMMLPAERRQSLAQWNENNVWDRKYTYGAERVHRAWTHRPKTELAAVLPDSSSKADQLVDRYLRSLIEASPRSDFRIVMLPYTVLYQRMLLDDRRSEFDAGVLVYRAVVQRLATLPNARVYDFRDDIDITHDLSAFKDLLHFSGRVSNIIVEEVAAERRRTDAREFELATDRLIRDAARYAIPRRAP
jgi:hypothetical protein